VGAGVDSKQLSRCAQPPPRARSSTFRLDASSAAATSSTPLLCQQRARIHAQNLPASAPSMTNMSQHVIVSVDQHPVVRRGEYRVLRDLALAMHRSSENNENNDIVSELGSRASVSAAKGAYGAPWFAVQGYSGLATASPLPPAKEWDGLYEGRTLSPGSAAPRVEVRCQLSPLHLAHVGLLLQNRGFYQFTNGFTTERQLRRYRVGPGQLPAWVARRTAASSRHSEHGSASVVMPMHSRKTAGASLRIRPSRSAALRVHEPLRDIARPWSNLIVGKRPAPRVIGGQEGLLVVSCSPIRSASRRASDCLTTLPRPDSRAHRYGIFYTPVNMNTWCNQLHNVRCLSETNQKATTSSVNHDIQLRPACSAAPCELRWV